MKTFRVLGGVAACLLLIQNQPLSSREKTVPELLQMMDSPAKAVRLEAMKELGNRGLGGKDFVPILSRNLYHKDRDMKERAAHSLAQIGSPAVPALLKALSDGDPANRTRALTGLGMMGPMAAPAAAPIARLLQDEDTYIRQLAGWALAEMGPAAMPATDALAAALRDPDRKVRLQAAQALHEIDLKNVRHIVLALDDKDPAVRLTAVEALTVFVETKEGLHAVVTAVRDADAKVRAAAAVILVRLGPSAGFALPGLLRNLEQPDRELQTRAFSAIMAIGSSDKACLLDGLALVNRSGGWADDKFARPAPNKTKEELRNVLPYLQAPNSTVRLAALLALGQMGPTAKDALPALRKHPNESDPLVRAAAKLALAAVQPGQPKLVAAAEELVRRSLDDTRSVRSRDPAEVSRLYILASVVPHFGLVDVRLATTLEEARCWSGRVLNDLPDSSWRLPELAQMINLMARFQLGFTEPFARLSFKLTALARATTEGEHLIEAFNQVAYRIPKNSPFQTAIELNQMEILKNGPFMTSLIRKKEERIELLANAKLRAEQMLLAQDQLLTLALNNIWVPSPGS